MINRSFQDEWERLERAQDRAWLGLRICIGAAIGAYSIALAILVLGHAGLLK